MGQTKKVVLVKTAGDWNKQSKGMNEVCSNAKSNDYLESSSSKKELLTALFEFSVIITLILEITCQKKGVSVISDVSVTYLAMPN